MDSFFGPLEHHREYFTKHARPTYYKKGEYLTNSHDPDIWVFFLVDGLVSVGFGSNSGDDRLIGYFLPGMTFAQSGSFFEGINTTRLDYKATTNCSVLRLPRDDFLKAVSRDPDLNKDYVFGLLRNQIFLLERIVYQSEKGVYNTCVRWLLFMARFYGQQIGPEVHIMTPITQEIAANFMNITRESAAVALKKLKTKKLISLQRKQATIHNLALLEKELN